MIAGPLFPYPSSSSSSVYIMTGVMVSVSAMPYHSVGLPDITDMDSVISCLWTDGASYVSSEVLQLSLSFCTFYLSHRTLIPQTLQNNTCKVMQ